MRLGLFYTATKNPWGGTYTIKEDIFRGLLSAVPGSGHELVVFSDDPSAASRFPSAGVTWVRVGGLRWRAWSSFLKKRINRIVSHGLLLPAPFASESWLDPFLFRAGVDLFVNIGPEAISMEVPYVCAVFDLQHRYQPYMPEVSAHGYWERWDEQYRQVLGRATFVITGTRVGRREIKRFYQVQGERLVTLPHPTPGFALAAAKEPAQPRPSYLRDTPFIFYPAQFWAHKNHVTLLEALALVRSEHELDLQLVLVGSDQGNKAFVVEQIAAMGLTGAVHVRGFVERSELIALYQHALALTYVSTCGPENLPPLEAFALGCPVINTDLPGAREQLGDAALIASMTDPASIADAVVTLYRDPARRDALVAAGRAIACVRTSEQFARGLFEAITPFTQKRKNWSAWQPYLRPHRIGRIFGR
jgi:glycosyltransferase involved in cell wall biosynthesis